MKINELLDNFQIYATNEEHHVMEKLQQPVVLDTLEEREQQVVRNMIVKSLVKRYTKEGQVFVVKNQI